jgi:hypothetical protein
METELRSLALDLKAQLEGVKYEHMAQVYVPKKVSSMLTEIGYGRDFAEEIAAQILIELPPMELTDHVKESLDIMAQSFVEVIYNMDKALESSTGNTEPINNTKLFLLSFAKNFSLKA